MQKVRLATACERAGLPMAGISAAIGARRPYAGPGQVLVSASVAESAPPQGVRFEEQGELPLKGFAHPVRLLEACRRNG